MVQKKRKQASGKQGASKKQKQDGQKAVSKDISVPIDEGFQENGKPTLLATRALHRRHLQQDSLANVQRATMFCFDTSKTETFRVPGSSTDFQTSRCRHLHQPGQDHLRRVVEPDQHWRQQQQGGLHVHFFE
jgi:hypothetical protein